MHRCETIARIISAMSSINVRGKLLAKLRKVGSFMLRIGRECWLDSSLKRVTLKNGPRPRPPPSVLHTHPHAHKPTRCNFKTPGDLRRRRDRRIHYHHKTSINTSIIIAISNFSTSSDQKCRSCTSTRTLVVLPPRQRVVPHLQLLPLPAGCLRPATSPPAQHQPFHPKIVRAAAAALLPAQSFFENAWQVTVYGSALR